MCVYILNEEESSANIPLVTLYLEEHLHDYIYHYIQYYVCIYVCMYSHNYKYVHIFANKNKCTHMHTSITCSCV